MSCHIRNTYRRVVTCPLARAASHKPASRHPDAGRTPTTDHSQSFAMLDTPETSMDASEVLS